MIAALSALGVVFLGSLALVFPAPWNNAMKAMDEKVGFHLPYLPESSFTLGLDLKGGAHLVYEADMSSVPAADRGDALEGVRDVIERRVNAFGVAEPIVQTNISGDSYRVFIDLPGVTDVKEAINQIGETPVLVFRLPTEEVNFEASPEQQAEIDAAQATERKNALEVMERALDGEDFAELAKEFSIDKTTKDNGGYVGFVTAEDQEFDGLVERIESDGLRRGVINGLYEGTSKMHIVKYISKGKDVEVEASHILICYEGATNCTETRTKEEAETLAQEVRDQVKQSNFADLAKQYSDEPNAETTAGELGFFGKGKMVKAFEDAVYALRDNRISQVVETEFGYHIIYRTDSRNRNSYEIAHIEMPWTTLSDVFVIDPWNDTQLSGKHIQRASVVFDPNTGSPYILLDFNSEGADLFAQITAENVGERIGIFLDGTAIATPVVQDAIYGGQASITGQFTLAEAKLLVQRLNAGALPVPVSVISQQTIGPTLGTESLDASVQAGLVGFALVALFLTLYYRLPGFVASVALSFYIFMNLALYKMFGVTVTLSGIAGFIFSLGIAVDANVLVFERLKEELRDGRDLPSAVDEAFRRAWPSIRDGNATTLIGTLVLYALTAGSIRGFALTLALGILVSLFTALVVVRTILRALVRLKFVRKSWLFLGLPKESK